MRFDFLLIIVLAGLVVYSTINLIVVRHQNRLAFIELQKAQQQRDQLNLEWSQLLIEQSTWSQQDRIEQVAKEKLKMIEPEITELLKKKK